MTIEEEIEKIIDIKLSGKLEAIANPVRLINEKEAMQILACDKVTLSQYRKSGLVYLETRPRKYLMQDIVDFIESRRKKFDQQVG